MMMHGDKDDDDDDAVLVASLHPPRRRRKMLLMLSVGRSVGGEEDSRAARSVSPLAACD